jgi:hypothetical protein
MPMNLFESITKIAVTAVFLLPLCAQTAGGDPPDVSFPAGSIGINVPLDTGINIDSFGFNAFLGNGFTTDGIAARTPGTGGTGRYARYRSTVQSQFTVTPMPVNQDWVAKVVYKHTGAYDNQQVPFFIKNESADKRIVSLWNDGGDNWSVRIGNASDWWDVAVGGLSLDVYWNTFLFHYKSATQSIDVYLNNRLLAADQTTGHGRYDLDYIQIEYVGAGTDWFGEIRIGSAAPATRSATFGHEWVRSKPFTLQALALRDNSLLDTRYRDAHFSHVLAWENNVGLVDKAWEIQFLPWHWHTGKQALNPTMTNQIDDWMVNRPGGEGMLVWDEPKRPDFYDVKEVTDWIRENYPNLLVYGNQSTILRPGSNYGQEYGTTSTPGPGYADPPVPYDYDIFVDDYMYVVAPDILQFDVYPFSDDPTESADQFLRDRSYYRGAEIIRAAGLRANVPYYMVMQSYDGGGVYMPSESDFRMQLFSALAYGFKGITYFTFDHFGAYGNTGGGMLLATHPCECIYTTNPVYDYAQALNPEITVLGETLKYLESKRVRYILGKHIDSGSGQEVPNDLPLGVTPSDVQSESKHMTAIGATNIGTIPDVTEGDLLIGYFEPAVEELAGLECEDDEYFMVVNLLREQNVSAADASQQIRIDFDFGGSGITRLLRSNRTTGQWDPVELTHDGGSLYHLDLVLPGGTGELFKYDNGNIPRIADTQSAPGGATVNFLSCSGIVYHVEETLDPNADPVVWTESGTVSNYEGMASVTNPAGTASAVYRLRGSQ